MQVPVPITTQPHYGEHLGDIAYWSVYVLEALDRHGLPGDKIETPFVGTFPTFLAGDVVVKLFADTFDGSRSFATEKAMGELLDTVPEIPAPRLIASGQLFGGVGSWTWPYLITERLAASPIRDLPNSPAARVAVEQLGRALAHLHALPPPAVVASRDLLPGLRANAPSNLRRSGLPDRLADEVPDFLADASEERVLVHADLTADHLFIDVMGLAGIIDWGDAIVADRWYELVALRFDALRTDPRLFDIFLEAYGWQDTADFPIRALQGVLEFQFNAIDAIADTVDLHHTSSLHELAHQLFDGSSRSL
jgi:hygromycin-B 7''-O-kinase